MKKTISIVLAMMMLLVCTTACGGKEQSSTQLANPVHECSAEEMASKTGVALEAPDGAEQVRYAYLDGEQLISQVQFSMNGHDYCYRAVMTDEIIDMTGGDSNGNPFQSTDAALQKGQQLSGCYEKWSQGGTAEVSYCAAVFALKNKGQGFISWFDAVPGILYSVSMDKCTGADELTAIAELCFVPAQAES